MVVDGLLARSGMFHFMTEVSRGPPEDILDRFPGVTIAARNKRFLRVGPTMIPNSRKVISYQTRLQA